MADGGGSKEDQWVLAPAERELVMTKNRANRLGFAILLTFFRDRGRFPRDETEVEVQGIAALAKQLDAPAPIDGEAFLTGRTAERLRGEIRVRFGFREATVADAEMLTEWLRDHVAGEVGGDIEPMIERLEGRCRELAIEPPKPDRMERIARSALRSPKTASIAACMGGCRPRLANAWMPCCAQKNRATGRAPLKMLKAKPQATRRPSC